MIKNDKALFRYRIIAPLLDPDLHRGDRERLYRELSERIWTLPDGKPVQFSRETIRSWYKKLNRNGFEALDDKPRADRGKSRALSPEIIKKACDLKIEIPQRTLDKIIDILEREKFIQPNMVKRSTLHRVFQEKHLCARIPKEKGYWQRYQAEDVNDLWQSDQMYGPWLPNPNNPEKKLQTQLLCWLDDRSRSIPHAQFFFKADLSNLEITLRCAIQKAGIPKKIYVDNGKIYTAKHLMQACSHLGIRLMFARPYCPAGKGKQERFFQYVQSCFLPELAASNIMTIQQLNEAFQAWLQVHYMRRIHSELDRTPIDIVMEAAGKLRYATAQDIKEAFLTREIRKVHKDCTFQLLGNYYEVMPALVRKEIEIRYDLENSEVVKVYLAGEFFQQAKILRVPPQRRKKEEIQDLAKSASTGINYLKRLVDEHKAATATRLFGPLVPSDNRLTLSDLLAFIDRKGFHLSSYERKKIQDCFDTYGPFDKELAAKTIETLLKLKGTGQHISFYLDHIVDAHQNKKESIS